MWVTDVALIQPLAWELPCAMGATLKRKKKKMKFNSMTSSEWQVLCEVQNDPVGRKELGAYGMRTKEKGHSLS